MPYTTLTAGTTITSSWANANVRDQVVTPFASVSARDSAITSPVNGMYATTTDTGFLWRYNGTKWLRQPTTVSKQADTSWTSTTTLSNDPDLVFAVDANGIYHYVFDLLIETVSTSVGLKTAITYPAGARVDYGIEGSVGSAYFSTTTQAASSGASTTFSTASNFTFARYTGWISVAGTAGNVQIQAAQGTSNASSAWILRGSSVKYVQVG